MADKNCVFELILALLSMPIYVCSKGMSTRIAIIGGGIGGTVTAYELSKLAVKSEYEISLDLFEEAEIGGRLATTNVNGHDFETGGSIINVDNKYMKYYVASTGLKPKERGASKENFGLYDGQKFIFVSSGLSYWDFLVMFWRYGFDIVKFFTTTTSDINSMMTDFERIYEAQEKQFKFSDVYSLLEYMHADFPDLMNIELKEYLKDKGYGDRFIDEFIFTFTKINYNQNTNIPVFVGYVSMAGSGPQLWSVEGGNKRVPEALLLRSDAKHIKARVESITLRPDSTFALAVDGASHIYDYVVIACPLISNYGNILKFEGFPDLNIPHIKYQKTVSTIVHGEVNHTFFHVDSLNKLPSQIFSVNDQSFYNSISRISPVKFDEDYDNKVFKVFSKDVLTDEQLDLLFVYCDTVVSIPWLAYPLYDTQSRNLSFELHNNLFYTNAIEWAASAMEMSAISAVNVALLISEKLNSDDERTEPVVTIV